MANPESHAVGDGRDQQTGPRQAAALEQGWQLSTTDRELAPRAYAWRHPGSVWSRHPHAPPAQLLAEHLGRRQRMMETLGIAVTTELTPEAYFAQMRKNNRERKEVLRSKTMETIRAEMQECKQSTIRAWTGDLPANCWPA